MTVAGLARVFVWALKAYLAEKSAEKRIAFVRRFAKFAEGSKAEPIRSDPKDREAAREGREFVQAHMAELLE